MENLDPKVYQALTESSQRRYEVLNPESKMSGISELLMLKQLQEEWNQNFDELMAA